MTKQQSHGLEPTEVIDDVYAFKYGDGLAIGITGRDGGYLVLLPEEAAAIRMALHPKNRGKHVAIGFRSKPVVVE